MPRPRNPSAQASKQNRQGNDSVPIAQTGTRLQENSGGDGSHPGKDAGESFAWDPADKRKPNPQRPVGKL